MRRSWLTAVLLLVLLAGCSNMKKQPNYRSFDETALFPNGSSARLVPAFTVAHTQTVSSETLLTGYRNGQPVSDFPIPVTRALIERGRERFNIYCSLCHGEDGYGRGIVVQRGFPAPPSYHDDRLVQAPVGHLFQVVSKGYGSMYSYADRITPDDRWAIVAYIRVLQRSQRGSLADVPLDQKGKLEP